MWVVMKERKEKWNDNSWTADCHPPSDPSQSFKIEIDWDDRAMIVEKPQVLVAIPASNN